MKSGPYSSKDDDMFGFFFIKKLSGPPLKVLSAPFDNPKDGWEHVSVSLPNRCPTWGEMCLVRDLFWTNDETVIQFHPPKSEYVNNHAHCLHLWRNINSEVELPPTHLVGVK